MITGTDLHPRYQAAYQPRARDAFCIIKAAEGRTVEYGDARLRMLRLCRAAGKIIGHYFWLHAGNVAAQVEFFASQPDIQPGDVLAVDWENIDPTVPVADLNAFVKALRTRFPQNRILVYTFACYAPFVQSGSSVLLADGLWIADYRTRSVQLGAPHRCDGQPMTLPWLVWQYTTNGETLDENRAKFDTAAEMRAWARGLIPKPVEAPLKAPYPTTSGNPGETCSCVLKALPLVEYRFRERGWIREDFSGLVTQWGYKNNDVVASSTTHNGGGVLDVRYALVDTDAKLRVWQECGFAPFRRRPPQWSSTVHGHVCVSGCPHIDPLAGRQVLDFYNGENGLGGTSNHTRYDGPIYVKRTWRQAREVYADLIEEIEMPTVKEILNEAVIDDPEDPNDDADGKRLISLATITRRAILKANANAKELDAVKGQLAKMQRTLDALVDMAQPDVNE